MTPAPARISYRIDLPFPVSANRLWRNSRGRIHLSAEYVEWKAAADGAWLRQKPPGRPVMLGSYELVVVLDRRCRQGGADGDNTLKCINDWLQRVELVRDDRYCERWSGSWGDAVAGCRIEVTGEPWPGAQVTRRTPVRPALA